MDNMTTIPIAIIVQWCGISTTTARNIIITDIMSPTEGLKHINGETPEEILGTFREYDRRYKEDRYIVFTRVQKRRLIFLVGWL